jgi:hypothetical protein
MIWEVEVEVEFGRRVTDFAIAVYFEGEHAGCL